MKLVEVILAQGDNPNLPNLNPIPAGRFEDIGDVLLFVIRGLHYLAGFIAIIYIIWSGYLFMTSGGSPEQAQKGRSGLLYAVVGLIVIALSFAIVNAVADTLGAGGGGGGGSGNVRPL